MIIGPKTSIKLIAKEKFSKLVTLKAQVKYNMGKKR
jgi:hypothetical protein